MTEQGSTPDTAPAASPDQQPAQAPSPWARPSDDGVTPPPTFDAVPEGAGGEVSPAVPPTAWSAGPPIPPAAGSGGPTGGPGRRRSGLPDPAVVVAIAVAFVALLGIGVAIAHPWTRDGAAAGDPQAWIRTTNAHCRSTVDPAYKAAAEQYRETDSIAYFTQMATITRDLNQVLGQGQPASLAAQVRQIIDAWGAMASEYEQMVQALEAQDVARAKEAYERSEGANARGNAVAKQIGLPDCADAGGIGVTPAPRPPSSGPII